MGINEMPMNKIIYPHVIWSFFIVIYANIANIDNIETNKITVNNCWVLNELIAFSLKDEIIPIVNPPKKILNPQKYNFHFCKFGINVDNVYSQAFYLYMKKYEFE